MKKRNSVKIDKDVSESIVVAGNHNKIIVIIKQLIKPYFIIPALILVLAGLYLIQKPPVTNVNIRNELSAPQKEDAKSTLNPFKTDIYGIIVAQFNGNTEDQKNKGKEIQSTIQSTLNARFKELGINDADARKTPDLFESHDQARDFGEKYQAQLVIWGDVTLQGIIPNITVVNQEDTVSEIFKPETTILKDSLCHAAMAQIKDIRFPALTDEPTKLVSFITGLKYFYKGSFEKAIEYFTYSLPDQSDKYIDSSTILNYRGGAHGYLKQYDKSVEDFTHAISLSPKDDKAYYNRGVTYIKKGEYDKTIADYSQAISLNPKNYNAYYNRGAAYFDKGEYDKAIADHTQAIFLGYSKPYSNRGVSYIKKGEYDKAMDDFNKAISLNLKDAAAYNNRGAAYFDKGEYDKAIADFNQAISLNPKDDKAYNNRGAAYFDKGEYDKAMDDFNKAISLNPKDYKAYNNRGVAYGKQGMYDKAIDDYNQAINLTPQFSSEFAESYNSMSRLLATCPDDKYRDGNKAIEFAQKALEIEPNNHLILDTLAAAYDEVGRFEDAVKTQEKAIELLSEKDKDKYLSEFTEHLNFYKARKPWREKPPQKSNLN